MGELVFWNPCGTLILEVGRILQISDRATMEFRDGTVAECRDALQELANHAYQLADKLTKKEPPR